MPATPPAHRAPRPDGSAAGQTVAMLVIALLFLPLLPLVLLFVAVVRVRDRLRDTQDVHQPAPLTQPATAIQPPAI